MSSTKEFVDKLVAENQVVIFSKSWCPYCKRAKALFAQTYTDAKVEIVELDERSDGGAVQDYLLEKTSQSSVPNIFIKQQHIGGSDDLYALHEEGGVQPLLN
ncbi:glutaredoxin [Gloeopeniophorella convolvens]|nr:glutaredoxin [Gloeopeniophorella convolvens]